MLIDYLFGNSLLGRCYLSILIGCLIMQLISPCADGLPVWELSYWPLLSLCPDWLSDYAADLPCADWLSVLGTCGGLLRPTRNEWRSLPSSMKSSGRF